MSCTTALDPRAALEVLLRQLAAPAATVDAAGCLVAMNPSARRLVPPLARAPAGQGGDAAYACKAAYQLHKVRPPQPTPRKLPIVIHSYDGLVLAMLQAVALDRARWGVEGSLCLLQPACLRDLSGWLDAGCPLPARHRAPPAADQAYQQLSTLSRRERQVVSRLLLGIGVVDLCDELGVTEYTLRNHFRHIYRKLAVQSRDGLLQRCVQLLKHSQLTIEAVCATEVRAATIAE